jgi:hypothetical protein
MGRGYRTDVARYRAFTVFGLKLLSNHLVIVRMVHIFGCFEATEALGALSEFTLAAFHNIGALFQGASARTSFSIPYKPKAVVRRFSMI